MRPALTVQMIALLVAGCYGSATQSPPAVVHLPVVLPAVITPMDAVDELLTADRGFSTASARTDLISGITAMLAPDVTLPVPGGTFADGLAAARAVLQRDTLNATSRAEWAPIRGGVSADAMQGFTFGFLTVTRADGTRVPMKYLAYWTRGPMGWRVAAYRRVRRAGGEPETALLPPALPAALVGHRTDAATLERERESVAQAERDFSRDAQTMGLGPAFVRYGSADAMNMGGSSLAGFVLGNTAIGELVGSGSPAGGSPVSWGPDHRVLAASSGDLGVTFGYIRPNVAPAAGQPSGVSAFFTVWRRAGPGAPWRYVAE